MNENKICLIPNCSKTSYAKKLCRNHYNLYLKRELKGETNIEKIITTLTTRKKPKYSNEYIERLRQQCIDNPRSKGKPNINCRKLNDEQIRQIKGLYQKGMKQTEIARRFKVHYSLISLIVRGKRRTLSI